MSNTTFGCTPPNDYGAAELDLVPTVFGAVRVASRVTLGARAGVGAAIYISDRPIGGDLFAPACAYGGSIVPDAYAALDVSLHLSEALHLVLFPATFDIHPSWDGSRSGPPVDASGAWIRLGLGFAFAVNL